MSKILFHFATNAKAYAAFVGTACAALLGLNVLGNTPAAHWLAIIAPIAAGIATWRIPNALVPAAPAPVTPAAPLP